MATGGGRLFGRRPQTNDADEQSDAIERRLRPAAWMVDLSPPIDPNRSCGRLGVGQDGRRFRPCAGALKSRVGPKVGRSACHCDRQAVGYGWSRRQ